MSQKKFLFYDLKNVLDSGQNRLYPQSFALPPISWDSFDNDCGTALRLDIRHHSKDISTLPPNNCFFEQYFPFPQYCQMQASSNEMVPVGLHNSFRLQVAHAYPRSFGAGPMHPSHEATLLWGASLLPYFVGLLSGITSTFTSKRSLPA